jgi:hypothetical protein
MADTKISALTAVATPATTDEFGVNQGGASKKMTLAQIIASVMTLVSGSSGAANQLAAPSITHQILTGDATNATTNLAAGMTTTSLPVGTYKYRYDLICRSDTATTSLKFNVDSLATVTFHNYRLYYPSGGVTAATGVMDQEVNATTGNVYAIASTRADATTLGPFTDVDTTNSDIHVVIEGLLKVSTSNSLVMNFAAETTGTVKIMTGSCLELIRLA